MSSNVKAFAVFRTTLLIASVLFTLEPASVTATELDRDEQVYFSLIVSSAPTLNSLRVVNAVDEALEFVENDGTILPGYSLQYSQVLDAQVRLYLFETDRMQATSSGCYEAIVHDLSVTTR